MYNAPGLYAASPRRTRVKATALRKKEKKTALRSSARKERRGFQRTPCREEQRLRRWPASKEGKALSLIVFPFLPLFACPPPEQGHRRFPTPVSEGWVAGVKRAPKVRGSTRRGAAARIISRDHIWLSPSPAPPLPTRKPRTRTRRTDHVGPAAL